MDASRFDSLTRALHDARSRRGALATLLSGTLGLLGIADMAAKAKKGKHAHGEGKKGKGKKGKGKKKKGGSPSPQSPPAADPAPPPPPSPPGCGAGAACGAGQLCVQGQCVTGQGTCPTGADFCQGETTPCGTHCLCWTTKDGQTRCGENISLSGCSTCFSDAGCAALFPTSPGVFCVQDTGTNCSCGNFCVAPCCTGQADGTACGSGKICAQGQCVTGQGSCAAGADFCVDGTSACGGPGSGCFCYTTKANQTRCGAGHLLTVCGTCASDADCAALRPDFPGAFCVKGGTNCGSNCGDFCLAPCPR